MKQGVLVAVLLGAAGLVRGCVVAAVGLGAAGTIAYVRGELQAVESEKLDVVYEATLKAAEKLQLAVTKKLKDVPSAAIVARDAQDKKVTVTLKAVSDEATRVRIRVGLFGSETKSRLIYKEIHENLRRTPLQETR